MTCLGRLRGNVRRPLAGLFAFDVLVAMTLARRRSLELCRENTQTQKNVSA